MGESVEEDVILEDERSPWPHRFTNPKVTNWHS
jgi:hypothetical protein